MRGCRHMARPGTSAHTPLRPDGQGCGLMGRPACILDPHAQRRTRMRVSSASQCPFLHHSHDSTSTAALGFSPPVVADTETGTPTAASPAGKERGEAQRPKRDPASLPLPPGDMGWPVVGESAAFIRDRRKFVEARRLKHGKVFKTHILGKPTVWVSDAAAIRRLLAGEHRLVITQWPTAMQTLLGTSFQGDKARHIAHRKIMGAAFTPEATASYLPQLQRLAQEWLERLGGSSSGSGSGSGGSGSGNSSGSNSGSGSGDADGVAASGSNTNGINSSSSNSGGNYELAGTATAGLGKSDDGVSDRSSSTQGPNTNAAAETSSTSGDFGEGWFSGWSECKDLSFAAATQLLTGFDLNEAALTYLKQEFKVFNNGFRFTVPLAIPGTPYGNAVAARQNIVAVIDKSLRARASAHRRHEGSPGGSSDGAGAQRRNVVDSFIEQTDDEGNTASYEDLKEMAFFTLFAGHVTTSMAMSHLIKHLHNTPAALAKLRQEQAQLALEHGDQITSSLPMPYTDACISEGLRLAGIVQTLYRVALQDLEVEGFRVPQGWAVNLMIGQTMRDVAEWMGDRAEFRPERWLQPQQQPSDGCPMAAAGAGSSSTAAIKAPDGYLPFGSGGRQCLGQPLAMSELRVLLSLLARDWDWELADPDESFGLFHDHSPPQMLMRLKRRRQR